MTTTLDIVLSAFYLAVGTALFVAALVLAILFHYRVVPHIQQNNYPLPVHYVLPQQPPPVHFYPPLPYRASAIDKHSGIVDRRDKEDIPGEMEVGIQEGGDGGTTRARHPSIPDSNTSSSHGSAGGTPHPARIYPTAADLARYLIQLGLGRTGPLSAKTTEHSPRDRPEHSPIIPATTGPHNIFISPTAEFDPVWDNLNEPY